MKIRKRIALTVVLLITMISGGVFAMNAYNVSSVFQTGGVKIALDQVMKLGKKEQPFTAPPAVVPGQKISMIPRVTNMAEPCYIRARVVIQMMDRADQQIELEDCYGGDDNWINRGEYLYYTEVLNVGQQTELYQGIKIPEAWTKLDEPGFRVNITVEAVQAKNITPEFQSKRPWGRIEAELSQVKPGYRVGASQKVRGNGADIIYEDGAKACIINAEKFFSDLGAIMPGDHYSDTLGLKNSVGRKIRVLFKASCKDSDLLRKVQLIIKQGRRSIYAGPLACDQLREYTTLATLNRDEKQNINFSIKVPAELKNTYQELQDQVAWWFAVEDINGNPIQTGDNKLPWTWIGFLLLSIGALCIIGNRRQDYEKNL